MKLNTTTHTWVRDVLCGLGSRQMVSPTTDRYGHTISYYNWKTDNLSESDQYLLHTDPVHFEEHITRRSFPLFLPPVTALDCWLEQDLLVWDFQVEDPHQWQRPQYFSFGSYSATYLQLNTFFGQTHFFKGYLPPWNMFLSFTFTCCQVR